VGPELAKSLKGMLMIEKESYSEKAFLSDVETADQQGNFIIANVARMVYYASFRQNEILNIKIKNVVVNGDLVSEIQPFLGRSTKKYASEPIILGATAKKFLEDHIERLKKDGYDLSSDAALFPKNKLGEMCARRTLIDQFKKSFEKMTFNKLRALGVQRMQEMRKLPNQSQMAEELSKFSRHSREDTTRRLVNGKVHKGGRSKKKDRPWEAIVKSVEGLARIQDKNQRINESGELEEKIRVLDCDGEIKASLRRLLDEHKSRLDLN